MATTIKTVMTYPLDGSTTDFNIPFEYLARKFVRVTLIGVDRKELILNQDYRFATKTTISTTRALGPADGYTLIEIRRFTSATDRLVDFTDGSILRAYDLNISQVQTLHVAEEARDLTADTLGVNNDGDLDARGRRIVNVADAKDPGDAINLGQIQRWNDSALNSANRAKQEADRATARANDANNSANASAGSASASAGSASASASSAELAKRWSISETAVEPNLESSRTYALHSQSYMNESKGAADRAKTSENNAKGSEINAKNSEMNAKSSETNAKASEERAIEEANKLGNWNKLAGTVDKVYAPGEDPENPDDPLGKTIWSYGLDAPVLRAYQGASIGAKWDGKDTGPFINWYRGKGELAGTLRVHSDKGLLVQGFPHMTVDGQVHGAYVHSRGDVKADGAVWADGNVFGRGDTLGLKRDTRWHITFQTTDGRSRMFIYKDPNSDLRINNGVEGGGDFVVRRDAAISWGTNGATAANDGNLYGSIWGGWLSNWLSGQLGSRTNEINHRIHDLRRGGVQEHNSGGAGDWEAPWGYFTGYRNRTGDGNIKFTTWICRQPQAYSNDRGWFDIGGNA